MLLAFCFFVFTLSSSAVLAADYDVRIPGEIEQAGGYAGAINNSGVSFLEGSSATKINPALLVETKDYVVSGSYHWPVGGREFYELGVVDGITSKYVASLQYNGFQEDYKVNWEQDAIDAPVKKRASMALALPLKYIAVGANASYVEGYTLNGTDLNSVKALTLGFGLYGKFTKHLKLGASIQNFNNDSIKSIAPMTIRAGVSLMLLEQQLLISAEFKQRQRIESYEGAVLIDNFSELSYLEDPERMAYLSSVVKVFDVVRLMGSYGMGLLEDPRKSASAGVGLAQGGYTFYYTIAKPYLSHEELAHSLSISLLMKM